MINTTLVLNQGDKIPCVLNQEFKFSGCMQSLTIQAPDSNITLIADAASAQGFFTALHDATGAIIDRLTLARLEAEAASTVSKP